MMPEINRELAALFDADRRDHALGLTAGTPEYDAMRLRDRTRRERALTILEETRFPVPPDYYHAAWLLNHGDSPDDAEEAHRLATLAAAGGHAPARWLAAASYDRWCMYRGLPQKFGTQIVPDGVGYRVWDTDPSVDDAERAANDVPPLAEQHRRAAESRRLPQPPMDRAPEWLRSAIERWRAEEGA